MSIAMTQLRHSAGGIPLLALQLAYCVLALLSALSTPAFEKLDEGTHFAFVRHLANGGALPVQPPNGAPWDQQGSQPPLYYALAALAIQPFDTTDYPQQIAPNASPSFSPFGAGNKNLYLIGPEKRFPGYQGSALAVIWLRLLGIPLGAAVIACLFGVLRLAAGSNARGLGLTALAVLNPMFANVMTAVGNDGLTILLATAAVLALARVLFDGISLPRVAVLAVTVALCSLCKVSGLPLLPIAGAALLALRRQPLKPIVLTLAGLALAWLALAGWWYARNVLLYGELTGTTMMASVDGLREPGWLSLEALLGEWRGMRWSYWGIFGAFSVAAPLVYYSFSDALLALAGVGLVTLLPRVRDAVRAPDARVVLIGALVFHAIGTFVALWRWTLQTYASQGRLLYPALAGCTLLLGAGLWALADAVRFYAPRVRLTAPGAWAVGLAATVLGVAVSLGVVAPAFSPPLLDAVPVHFRPVTQRMAPLAEVLGYHVQPRVVRAGEPLRISVALRALARPGTNYFLVAKLYDHDGALLVRKEGYTGSGLYPSLQWQAGQLFRDEIELNLPAGLALDGPELLRVQFDLYNRSTGETVSHSAADGSAGAPLFDALLYLPSQPASAVNPQPLGRLGDFAALEGASIKESTRTQQTLELRWLAQKSAPVDYTLFVHVVDDSGALVAQADAPPRAGRFPTTRWQADVRFAEVIRITPASALPKGRYRVLLGFYEPVTGMRVISSTRPDGALEAAQFTIDD